MTNDNFFYQLNTQQGIIKIYTSLQVVDLLTRLEDNKQFDRLFEVIENVLNTNLGTKNDNI
jgi:hypothetical protein